jgi:hypothetical protein
METELRRCVLSSGASAGAMSTFAPEHHLIDFQSMTKSIPARNESGMDQTAGCGTTPESPVGSPAVAFALICVTDAQLRVRLIIELLEGQCWLQETKVLNVYFALSIFSSALFDSRPVALQESPSSPTLIPCKSARVMPQSSAASIAACRKPASCMNLSSSSAGGLLFPWARAVHIQTTSTRSASVADAGCTRIAPCICTLQFRTLVLRSCGRTRCL